MRSCRIICFNQVHDPIELEHGKPICMGRGPLTKIKDPRLSRNQIELTADCLSGVLTVKQVGQNCSVAGGKKLTQHETVQLKHDDTLELLEDLHKYRIEFDPPPDKHPLSSTDAAEMVGRQTTLNNFLKRKKTTEENASETQSPSKRVKNEESWAEIDNGKLIVFTTPKVDPRPKIAAFDLDGTIITTQSGKVFPTNCQDWKLLYSQIVGKLKQLIQDKFKIVIFTNQAGLSNGKVKPTEFRQKLRDICNKLGVPIQVFISPGTGVYRKPAIGMWKHLVDQANENVPVDVSASFYCGDAAGREAKWAPGKKKDHSSVDRLFALNVGLKFYTPEEYFLGQRPVPYKDPEFNPSALDTTVPLLEPQNAPLFTKEPEVIILVGFPGSGKSHFATQHAVESNYEIINRDLLGTWQKCVAVMEKSLDSGRSVLIDNTNPDKESRSRFVRLAAARGIPCRCFIMSASQTLAMHNNKFRELTDEKHSTVSRMIFNVYKSKFQEPSMEEGFSQLVRVNFRPEFRSPEDERLYKMFLLED